MIVAKTIAEAKWLLLKKIKAEGWKQCIDSGSFAGCVNRIQIDPVFICIKEPLNLIDLPVNECMQHLDDYALSLFDFSLHAEGTSYTYGERIAGQLSTLLAMLSDTPQGNQAILTISRSSDIMEESPPCLREIHFMVKNETLDMTVYMRSNDIENAFFKNMYGLASFQSFVSEYTGHLIGKLFYFCSGAHVYNYLESRSDSFRK